MGVEGRNLCQTLSKETESRESTVSHLVALVENDFGLIILKTRLSGGVLSFRERIEPKVDAVLQYLLTEYHSDEFCCSLVFCSMC